MSSNLRSRGPSSVERDEREERDEWRKIPVLRVCLAPKTAIPASIFSILYETIDVRGEEATELSSVVISRFVLVVSHGWFFLKIKKLLAL